jgi:hypothetical protein
MGWWREDAVEKHWKSIGKVEGQMDLIKIRFFALHLRLSICLSVCLWASDRATSFPLLLLLLLLLLLPRLPRKVPRYFSHLRSISRSHKLITASAPMLSTFLSMGPIPHFGSPTLSLLFHHLGLPFPSSPLPFPSLPFLSIPPTFYSPVK